jgi:alpha-glucosidase
MASDRKFPYFRGRVVYQIYPRSFQDSNSDGIGDIPGIIERLDYLNDGRPASASSLGVSMIWLSPFYPSPMDDFGYDISDYQDVHPLFGTLTDFKRLVLESHRRGIKVMIDFVPNHSSDQHAWFKESRASQASPKRDWYYWRDPAPDGGAPNNWLSVFGGSAWEFDPATGQYYLHSFLKQQPDLNWENRGLRDAMLSAIRFWLKIGVDGIRVDAVDWMAKDLQFRDNPPNPRYVKGRDDPYHAFERRYSQSGAHLYKYLRAMAEVVRDNSTDGFMVTENYPDRRNVITEYIKLYQNYLTSVSAPFNFEGMYLPWEAAAYKGFIDAYEAALEPDHLPVYVLGNHDNSRLATRIGPKAARTAALLELTLPGSAFIYYGDEIGMLDVNVPPDRVQDPFEKRVPGLGLGRDPERTPMQWSSARHAGFSRVQPWLPVPRNAASHNVEQQLRDPASTLQLYRKLIHLRNTSPILQYGRYIPLNTHHPDVYGYIREYKGFELAVVLNFSASDAVIRTDLGTGLLLYSAQLYRESGLIDLSTATLPPHEGYVVALDTTPRL